MDCLKDLHCHCRSKSKDAVFSPPRVEESTGICIIYIYKSVPQAGSRSKEINLQPRNESRTLGQRIRMTFWPLIKPALDSEHSYYPTHTWRSSCWNLFQAYQPQALLWYSNCLHWLTSSAVKPLIRLPALIRDIRWRQQMTWGWGPSAIHNWISVRLFCHVTLKLLHKIIQKEQSAVVNWWQKRWFTPEHQPGLWW